MKFFELLLVIDDTTDIKIVSPVSVDVQACAKHFKHGSGRSPYNYLTVKKISVASISEQEAYFYRCPPEYLIVELI